MSTIEPDRDVDAGAGEAPYASGMYPPGQLPSFETPIVPKATVAGRALTAVVTIITFIT